MKTKSSESNASGRLTHPENASVNKHFLSLNGCRLSAFSHHFPASSYHQELFYNQTYIIFNELRFESRRPIAESYLLSGFMILPIKRIVLDVFSLITNPKGLSQINFCSSGPADVTPIPTVVTAAASVPFSSMPR